MEAVVGVVGLTAAIGQFIEQSTKLVRLINSVREKIKDGRQELDGWASEIELLQWHFQDIQDSDALKGDPIITRTIEALISICQGLSNEFQPLEAAAGSDKAAIVWKGIKGVAAEPKIRRLFEDLERHKSTLQSRVVFVTRYHHCSSAPGIPEFVIDFLFSKTTHDLSQQFSSLHVNSTDEEGCLRDLLLSDPRNHRDMIINARGERVQGTCEWIKADETFERWMHSPSGLLWICGGPGKGKTYLSIYLSEWLESATDNIVIYFFCDNKNATQNSSVAVLRGLLYGLIQQRRNLIRHIIPSWRVEREKVFDKNRFEDLWRFFKAMVHDLKEEKVVCILDGLDECDDISLKQLVPNIKRLCGGNLPSEHTMKVVVVSRLPPILKTTLAMSLRIDIDERRKEIPADVALFIDTQLQNLAAEKGIIQQSLLQHIQTTFRQKSEGTFLWVSLMAEDLKSVSLDKIEDALERLPTGLDAVYERILSQVDATDLSDVKRLLSWVALAVVPMHVKALAEALGISDSQYLSAEDICRAKILCCGHFLQLLRPRADRVGCFHCEVPPHEIVTFVHQSAKEFVMKSKVCGGLLDHQKIASVLIKCSQSKMISEVFQNSLSGYNYLRLADHLKQLDAAQTKKILEEYPSYFSEQPEGSYGPASFNIADACRDGLVILIRLRVAQKRRRNKLRPDTVQKFVNNPVETRYCAGPQTPLTWALISQSMELVQFLLELGAEVDRNVFKEAFRIHNLSLFTLITRSRQGRLFMQRDAKQHPPHYTLLHLAAFRSRVDICSKLIEEHKYTVETMDGNGWKPLHVAMRIGDVPTARLLVDTYRSSRSMSRTMQDAICQNICIETKILTFLAREWKVNINAVKTREGGSLLHCAFQTFPSIILSKFVGMWLFLGGDPFPKDDLGRIPFQYLTPTSLDEEDLQVSVIMLLYLNRLSINGYIAGYETPTFHLLIRSILSIEADDAKWAGTIVEFVTFLLDIGGDRAVRSITGDSAVELVRSLLLEANENPRFNVIGARAALFTLSNYATVPRDPQGFQLVDDSWRYSELSLNRCIKEIWGTFTANPVPFCTPQTASWWAAMLGEDLDEDDYDTSEDEFIDMYKEEILAPQDISRLRKNPSEISMRKEEKEDGPVLSIKDESLPSSVLLKLNRKWR